MNSGNTNKVRDEIDQHVVAGVLTATFKDMHTPIMLEVYNDVLNTDINDDIKLSIATIRNWIVKIPSPKFEIIKQLFALLHTLASPRLGCHSDSNPTQLAFNLAPFICRPYNSAYMSIRHMEDLLKIRPVIAFLIEHFNEILTKDVQPRPPVVVSSSQTKPNNNYNDLPSPIRNQSHRVSDNIKPHVSYPFPPNIQIPFDDEKSTNHNNTNAIDNDVHHVSRNINFQSWEWKMLETLTVARLDGILKESSMRSNRNDAFSSSTNAASGSSNSSSSGGNAVTKKIRYETMKMDRNDEVDIDKLRIDPEKNIENNSNNSSTALYATTSSSSVSAISKSNTRQQKTKRETRGIARRRMVSECKSLRSKISQFEEEWYKDNNRAPIKNADRGPMQAVYTKYREIKKAIRDHAATDIQRYIRGHIARLRRKRDINQKESSVNNVHNIETLKRSDNQLVDTSNISRLSSAPTFLSDSKSVDRSHSAADKQESFPTIPTEIYSKYRELLGEKRELKRKLKRFDEDFESQHGRVPNRSDKEVMRPLYQKYHDVKSHLDDLMTKIEASHGPLPEEFNEGGPLPSNNRISQANSFANSDAKVSHDRDSSFFDRDISDSKSSNIITDGITRISGIVRGNPLDLESLQTEKRDLHAYLKAYERDFTRTHGRPVMKHEDIAPVNAEYDRYKELKQMLSSIK